MRMDEGRESDNVEDRRDDDSGGGSGGGLRFGGGSMGIGTIAIALVASYFLGINPLTVLSMLSGGGGAPGVTQQPHQDPAIRRSTSIYRSMTRCARAFMRPASSPKPM